ncbi:hypothetical protein LZ198_09805 [Myxococcus sp. K15C18031901]|uniref:hypothetical protein n=1 Tax=Myxococcus dinghuensis TaxID=2906761 RepID=UPI0020A7EF80|nr:hypothetical protein [Myxococcus dinghuensis]MCP3099162.1 hypothetical protein [Myxococcus dinghuensis]
MDGGLAVLGFCLFLFSIANLYARTAYGLAFTLVVVAVVSMGMAFSESRKLRELSLGLSGVLLVAAVVSLAVGSRWWLVLGAFLFSVAYATLWAEFRFPYFGHVRQEDLPPPHAQHARRMNVHWPWHRRRTV